MSPDRALRRVLAAAAGSALLAATLPPPASAAEATPEAAALQPREAAPGVFVLAHADRFGSANAGWIALDDRTVLVGAPHAEVVPHLLAEAARTAGKPVREAVFTQAGEGEAGAVRVLAARGIALLASPDAARALRAGGLPADARLEEVAARRALPAAGEAAGREVELLPLGHAAAPGCLAVWVKGAGVLFAGDTCVNGPRVRLPGSNTARWLEALAALRRLEPRIVIPGRGTPGGPEVLARHQRLLRELRRQVGHRVAMGWPAESIRGGVRLEPEWLVWMPYDTPVAEDIDHLRSELSVPAAPFHADPFRDEDPRPRALAIIGDGPHEPGHLEDGLAPAFEAAGVAVRFAVDPRALSAENLQAVRLLVILRDGNWWPDGPDKPGRGWMTAEQERAVADFVAAGGGFLALHNATGLYPENGPYLQLLGGTYQGHGPLERFRVRVVDAGHPITRGVSDYEVADEQHTPRPDAGRVHLLLESRSAEGVVAAAGWVREAGKGRVAYLANGHTRDALGQPMYRRLVANGIRWCLRLEDGEPVREGTAELRSAGLRVLVADNQAHGAVHRAGYNGVAELESAGLARNLFVPAVAGLNFEHVLSGDAATYGWSIFEPRLAPMTLHRLGPDRLELRQERTENWPLRTRLTYELAGADAIDFTVAATPLAEAWNKHGYIGLFFASYIEVPEDKAIHFLGRSRGEPGAAAPRWIRHLSPRHGEAACHRPAGSGWDPPMDPAMPIVLASGHSDLEYAYPFYYGVTRGQALIFCFEKPSAAAEARFAQSPTGGGPENPAWDFLFLKRGYEVGKEFRFRMRLVCREFRGREDAIRAYEEWSGEQVERPREP
jgi:type 1 glutamine amidotransferase/glyoxylase-like metal-dependent hydrolase (beta-lactamase superfamily II)